MQIEGILAADIRICRVHLCTVWGSEERRGRTTPSTEFLLSLTVLHIFLHPSFFQLRCLSPLHPPPSTQSLTSFLPATLYISADQRGPHYEGISWLQHLGYKKKRKKKRVLCIALWFQLLQTGLIETASSQHYNQHFPIQIAGAESTFPPRFNMPPSLSATLPVHVCLHKIRIIPFSLSHSLAVCTVGPNS